MLNRATMLFFAVLAVTDADTLTLRDGTKVTGQWLGGSADQIRFLVGDPATTYPRASVAAVTFGDRDTDPRPPVQDVDQMDKLKPGQTINEVVAIAGQPKQIIDLGDDKLIYTYPGFKVTFEKGKLTAAKRNSE